MSKPSTVTLRVPKELKQRLEIAAKHQGVSLNQFALYILAGEVARLESVENDAWQALEQKYANIHPDLDPPEIIQKARSLLKQSRQNPLPDWDQ